MGCCTSRHAADDAAGQPAQPSVSSRSQSPATAADQGLNIRAANSLRKPKAWRASSRTWSRAQLDRERTIFWETQVAGRREIWAAVQLAVEMVRNESDLRGAKTVLEASGCTCPTGRLGEGVWDERGLLYKLPRWVVSDPVNLAENDDVDAEEGVAEEDDEDDEGKEGFSDFGDGDDKGKAAIPTGPNAITVRTRLSDRGTDVVLVVGKDQPVKALIKRIQSEAGIPTKTKLKLAYLGKVLKDNDVLMARGWQPGHVVNVLVFQ